MRKFLRILLYSMVILIFIFVITEASIIVFGISAKPSMKIFSMQKGL